MKLFLKMLAALSSAVFSFLLFVLLVGFAASIFSCERKPLISTETLSSSKEETLSFRSPANAQSVKNELDPETLLQSLEEIADLERAGSWLQGMALTESSIREMAGDIPGAVAAAYKELAFAYSRGLIQKEEKDNGILSLLELKNDQTTEAANAILAFSRGEWEQALKELSLLFAGEINEEPDSFVNWMLLVCALENQTDNTGESRRNSSAYRSIRARYSQFPEYWYRGARTFSGAIAAEYAENCINSSPQGPFAQECRNILAEFAGLKSEDGLSIKTKREIESLVTQSVKNDNPEILDSLMPLIDLPDNPYTVYAVSVLRSLTSIPGFRDYFASQAGISSGRKSERLLFISRS